MKLIEVRAVDFSSDARGFAGKPVDEEELKKGNVSNIHLVSLNPGAVRGNHYHTKQTEKIWLIGGPCRVLAKDRSTGETEEKIFADNEHVILVVKPGISHAFQNVSQKIVCLFCYSNYTPAKDEQEACRDELIK